MSELTATESDVVFAHWLGARSPYKKRTGLFIPPAELRRRAYDDETDQMVAYLRGERRTVEEKQLRIAEAVLAKRGSAA